MKGIQSTQLRCHISFLLFVQLTTCLFYPAGNSCWIHVNVGCSACIYSTLFVVSLNDEYQLVYRGQQSEGSAFQFHYMDSINKSHNTAVGLDEIHNGFLRQLPDKSKCFLLNVSSNIWTSDAFLET